MLLAHNCDRRWRGWFSSQIPDFLRRRRTRNTCGTSGRRSLGRRCFRVRIQPTGWPVFSPKKSHSAMIPTAIRCSLHRNLPLILTFSLYPQPGQKQFWKFFSALLTLSFRGRFPSSDSFSWLVFQPLLLLFHFFFAFHLPSLHSQIFQLASSRPPGPQ
jgi:hypothetical protein